MRHASLALIATAVVLTLAACDPAGPGTSPSPDPSETVTATPTPTPTPTPTAPPALADLVLSAEGMGTLAFGEAPVADPTLRMIAEDPAACSEFAPAGTPEATRWRPVPLYVTPDSIPFGVAVSGGLLERIDLLSSQIPTDQGIRVGATLGDLQTAYPGAAVVETGLTDVYVVTGVHGTLQIEVARERGGAGYWPASELDHVAFIHASVAGYGTFSVAASENVAGGCL